MSPYVTTTVPRKSPSVSVTIRTACPVPSCWSWTTTSAPGDWPVTSALTWSLPSPPTTTSRSGSSSPATARAWPTMLRPHSECRTLGRRDFMRLPSPAARTSTAAGRLSLTRNGLLGYRAETLPGPSSPGTPLSGATPDLLTRSSSAGYRPVAEIGEPTPRLSRGRSSPLARAAWLLRWLCRVADHVGDDQFARLDAAALRSHRGQLGAHRLLRAQAPLPRTGERRGDGADQAGRDREPEGDAESVVERAGDQVREELPADQVRGVRRVELVQQRAEQLLHRVVAEERGEQHPDRRQVRDRRGRAGRDALRGRAAEQRRRQLARQPDDHQREEDADRQHGRGVHERGDHAACGAALIGRHGVHHLGAVRRDEQAGAEAVERDEQRELPVDEVHRQEREDKEGRRRQQRAAHGERFGAETVGKDAGQRR